jgi:NAD(P)-dependent dehydrogenase (short-subunit alcohol dehydrogenase family)
MAFDDKMALVTGAGSGIGRGISLALGARGAAVAAFDIDGSSAEGTAALIEKAGGRAKAFQGDTSRAEDIDCAVGDAVSALGPLGIMVNNAGIADGFYNADQIDEAFWRRVIDIDLTGVFLGSKRAIEEMLPRGYGRIVNIASTAGLHGAGGGVAYVAAKHGVIGITRQMALAYASRGITVNAVCPGPIQTSLRQHSKQILGAMAPDAVLPGTAASEEELRARVPVGRRGTVEEIAAAVCYLASEEAAFVTGQALAVDGGGRAR